MRHDGPGVHDRRRVDAIYAEAVDALGLADEQWDREWAALNDDTDFTD